MYPDQKCRVGAYVVSSNGLEFNILRVIYHELRGNAACCLIAVGALLVRPVASECHSSFHHLCLILLTFFLSWPWPLVSILFVSAFAFLSLLLPSILIRSLARRPLSLSFFRGYRATKGLP